MPGVFLCFPVKILVDGLRQLPAHARGVFQLVGGCLLYTSFYDYLNVHPDADFKLVAQTAEASHVAIPVLKSERCV